MVLFAFSGGIVSFAQTPRTVGISSNSTESSVKVSGEVTDLDSGEPLRSARIHVDGSDWGIPTDSTGVFHIFIVPGNHKFAVIKNGYRSEVLMCRYWEPDAWMLV
ncbi:MAG: hypothetical protein R3B47_12455 [Bacteroidia bacterium]